MKYFYNGADMGDIPRQFAYSCDGEIWNYVSKDKIREITGYGNTVKLHYENGDTLDIPLDKLIEPATWNPSEPGGLQNAMYDLSMWLDQAPDYSLAMGELKRYQFGMNGFDIIQPNMGLQSGNWYLIKTLEETVITSLLDGSTQLIGGGSIPNNSVLPECTLLTTSKMDSTGFTKIQLLSGRVIAYRR